MRGLGRPSGLCSLLVFPVLVCVQATFAETNNPTPPTASATTPHQAVADPTEHQGDLLLAHGSYSAAIRAYQRVSRRSAVLFNNLGVAYHHLFAYDQARKYYRQALAINPRFAEAMNNLAAVDYGQRDFAQAERLYKEALQYEPDGAVILANLGTTYFADDKYKLGMEAYQKALVIDPKILHGDPRVVVDEGGSRRQTVASDYYLAKMYAAAGKVQEAIDYLRKALDAGFHDRKHLMKDKELAALRSTPEFHELLVEHKVEK